MEIKELIESLEKGWPGWLALCFVVLKESNIGSKAWGFFVRKHESRLAAEEKKKDFEYSIEESYQKLAQETLAKAVKDSQNITSELVKISHQLEGAERWQGALIEHVRILSSELGLIKSKIDQLLEKAKLTGRSAK